MSYVKPLHEGCAYGNGVAAAGGLAVGQLVVLSANNTFDVNDAKENASFGIVKLAVDAGEEAVIYCGGGIYETDAYEDGVAAGEALGLNETSGLLDTAGGGAAAVAMALSVSGGVLRFKLLV